MRKSTFALATSILVAIAWFGVHGKQPQAADVLLTPPDPLWEYLQETDITKIEVDGSVGWEMCGVITDRDQKPVFFFKRRIPVHAIASLKDIGK